MASYNHTFAGFYDRLTADVDHSMAAEFCLMQMSKRHPKCELILDLACGTGSMAEQFASRGLETIGVDASPDMLAEAMTKNEGLEHPVLYICQPMERLDLYGTVDLAVCTLDSLNHLTGRAALKKALHRLQYFVDPGGLFIFDMNTPYKHDEVLGNHTFFREADGVCCVWQCECEPEKDHRVQITLDFFAEDEDGRYTRSQESFCEYAYSVGEMRALLLEEKFELLEVCGDYQGSELRGGEERTVYVAARR